MKIITWNCHMAFRKKAGAILKYQPDVLIVPECEHPDRLLFPDNVPRPQSQLWFGHNPNKGLGIFSYNGYQMRTCKWHNPNLRYIVPIDLWHTSSRYLLYAVWANHPDDPDGRYVEQVWKAVHQYGRQLKKPQTLLAGDFNSNTIWDRPRRIGNHSHLVNHLEKFGIASTYHHYQKKTQGKEAHPTLYMYRHEDKPYHIDYCFASADLISRIRKVTIGRFKTWCRLSDHVPVMVDFADGNPATQFPSALQKKKKQ